MTSYRWIRPVLFRFDPELAHQATLTTCRMLGRSGLVRRIVSRVFEFEDACLATTVGGIEFSNPIGLAAGFDKNAIASRLLPSLGFGTIEIGSVSAFPSQGNQLRPRLFRLPRDEGLMVYYGVPSHGADIVARRLSSGGRSVPMGISLVETNRGRESRVDEVIAELTQAARAFCTIVDYMVLNLNCPNSSGGRSAFDEPGNLGLLLDSFRDIAQLPPLFLKITPPADPAMTDRILDAVRPYRFLRGFILNTHAPRPYAGLNTPQAELDRMHGSLTGAPLREPVNAALRSWYRRIDRSRHALIGVGGISSAEDAYRSIRAGASLVQICTALVYRGPGLVQELKKGLARLLKRDGIRNIADAVGIDNPRGA